MEKLIFSRTTAFFEKHYINLPTQYGFRANHSTTHALLDVITSSFDNINDNCYTALVFLNLKKAFDTANHYILLRKLECNGIRGVAHDLFSSFLSKRLQYVSIENELSSFKKCDCGVPQGAVLGPLLFTMYINDISSSATNSPRLFADDTYLILLDKDLNTLHKKVTAEISSVSNWIAANKLTLN